MARRGRRKMGTSVRREFDMASFARGLERPGLDTRMWVEWGTVATVGDAGDVDYGDGDGVVISPGSVDVDVVIEPHQIPVTCRYGLSAGDFFFIPPIRPGDLVLVLLPGGDPSAVGKILCVEPNPNDPLPVEEDGKPVFRNDRVHLFAKDVPIEVRTAGGARLVLAQDGSVTVNQGSQGAARKGDSTKLTLSAADVTALAVALLATGGFTPASAPGPGTLVEFDGGEVTGGSDSVKIG